MKEKMYFQNTDKTQKSLNNMFLHVRLHILFLSAK